MNENLNLLALDVLIVADTRLGNETDEIVLEEKLSNWVVDARFDSEDKIKHMGMLVLKSKKLDHKGMKLKITEKSYWRRHYVHMQVVFVSVNDFCLVAGVYVRETPSKDDVDMLEKDLLTIHLVLGDLNLDPNRSKDLQKLEKLCQERKRVLTELTTTRNNQLDHVLLNVNKFPVYFCTSFTNHTSDHNCIVCRIAKDKKQFKQAFKEKISFDSDLFTTPSKRRKIDTNLPKSRFFSKAEIKREDNERKSPKIKEENAGSRNCNDSTTLDASSPQIG